MRKVTISLLAVAAIVATAGATWANNGRHEGPITNGSSGSTQEVIYRSYGECNDCWASGLSLRESGNPTNGLTGGTIAVPPNVANTRVYAQIFWVTLGDAPILGPVAVNGNLVTPIPIGPVTPSPCWAQANAYAFRADVTGFIIPGVNTLSGFADAGNRQATPSVEGVSLVIVHRTQTVDKEVVILAGNDAIPVLLQPSSLNIPVVSAAGFGAELTLIVGDGQSNGSDGAPDAGDTVDWNGTSISAPNAFIGLDPGPGVGFWDTEEFGVATGGANNVTVTSGNGLDCLNWVATVLCVKRGGCVVPVEPSTWSKIKNLQQ